MIRPKNKLVYSCPECGEEVELGDWCPTCKMCSWCCECDIGGLFDADELGLDPERDDQRAYPGGPTDA